jgi:hypothetical protein
VGKAFSKVFFDGVLTRVVNDPADEAWDVGTAHDVSYSCKALVDTWEASHIARGLVTATEAKLLILASTLSIEPKSGDYLTVKGLTYLVTGDGGNPSGNGMPAVSTDPAKAVWVCRGRAS